jgi:hypothetical protein
MPINGFFSILLIKTIINRYTAVFNENKDAGEIFREM